MYCFHSRLFRMLLVTILLNQNKTILSHSYVEQCQYLHPSAKGLEWHSILFHEKQYLAGTCMLLRFPSLVITDRLSYRKSMWMSGRREPSSPSLGVASGFPDLNTKAARNPPFPSRGWYFHSIQSCSSQNYVFLGGKKSSLLIQKDTLTTTSKHKARHRQCMTAVCDTVPDAHTTMKNTQKTGERVLKFGCGIYRPTQSEGD